MAPLDYVAIFASSPNPYMVLDPEYRFLDVNAAYERVTGQRRADLLGTSLFESFPDDPNAPGAANQHLLRASLDRVLATGRRDEIPLIRYAIPVPGSNGRLFEDRFWSATRTPLLDGTGAVIAILQHTEDVTELHRLRQEVEGMPEATEGSARSASVAGAERDGGRVPARIGASVLRRAHEVQQANVLLDVHRPPARGPA